MIRQVKFVKPIMTVLVALVCMAATARAADPNGTWTWKFTTQNGQEIQSALTLKQEGEKLTGKVTRNDRSTDISDGTFKDGEVAFNLVRERDGRKITSKYKGRVEGDSIKGKIEFEVGGETRSFDWNATREKK